MEGKLIGILAVALAIGLAAGAGIGYVVFDGNDVSADETYWFYLYFEEGDAKNKWYSATGPDATVAFENAMKAANITWVTSSIGYVSNVGGTDCAWASFEYLWDVCDEKTAVESVLMPLIHGGMFIHSNGWRMFFGFDTPGSDKMKLYQSNSNVFILSPYGSDDLPTFDPKSGLDQWNGSGPFAS